MRFLAMPMTLLLAGLATSSMSSACSIDLTPIPVGFSFKVKVSGYDGPVKGLLLRLNTTEEGGRSAVTDDNGVAHFRNVPPGRHYLRADHDNGFGEDVAVKPNGPENIIVPMTWPSVAPIRVRSLSGTMRAPDAVRGRVEQRVMSIKLLDGISGRILSSTNTTERGEFDFGKLPPGLYFINLKPYSVFHGKLEGLISVAVDPTVPARADKLYLSLYWSSCGLMYTDPLQCPELDLHVTKFEGHATDFRGGPLRRAQVVLLDATENIVVRLSTDADGNFAFAGPLAGTFELRIDGGAFTSVRSPIHIETTAGSSSLEIETAFAFGCSTVRAK